MSKILLSQSFMKALNHGFDQAELPKPDMAKCPMKAKAIYIEGMQSYPTDAMVRGNFFETLVFGSTDSGEKVAMRETKSGGKSVDQTRIEQHALELRTKWKNEFIMDWHSPREHILVTLNDKYDLRARTDMVTSMKIHDGSVEPKVITDWKVTDSILANHGDFAWGVPEAMDHTQAACYTWAFEMKYGFRPYFFYWVFDLSPARMMKIVGGKVNDELMNTFKQNLKRVISAIEHYLVNGWPLIPSYDNCKGCPIRNECPAYKQGKDIQLIW